MASTLGLLLLLFLFMLFTIETTNTKTEKHDDSSKIWLGSSLSPKGENRSWSSSSGHFGFGFYPQGSGFAVGIWLVNPSENKTTVVWTAKRDDQPLSSKSMLNLTEQGPLLQNGNGDSPYNIYSGNSYTVSWAIMHDSGNFMLYDNDSGVIWQSFHNPTDTILAGQSLIQGDELVSSMSKSDHSSGRFILDFLSEGNVVAYPFNSFRGDQDVYLDQQGLGLNIQGFLCSDTEKYNCMPNSPRDCYLFTSYKLCNKSSNKPQNNTTSIYRATLDVDGNLRLYEHQFHFEGNNSSPVVTLWQALNDTCLVKGLCGLNSYCSSNMSGDAVCNCFPGFILSKTKTSRNMPKDCIQTHTKDDCESIDDPTLFYNFTHYKNISWGDDPYSVIPMMKNMETCEKACRQDCGCGGAIYVYANASCNKYRLPLIYGRLQNDSSSLSMALLKIASPTTPITSNHTNVPKPTAVVDNKSKLIMILCLTLGFVTLIYLVLAVSVIFTYRRQVKRYAILSESERLEFTEECSLRSFSFDEIVKSTGEFSEEIGRGSFGAVYKGKIGDNNRSIAVKRLEERIADEGEREFQAEITTIARTHHRNLVKLIGFCIEGTKKLLVYEFVSKGSLANLLFEGETRLSWKERMKLALDVARGLLYLHEECEVRIIHCNINTRNILMDEAWTAKISDFGLARLIKRSHSRTKIGANDNASRYLAPEWQKDDASISVKADIYSFGVVLLEIICGRRSIEMDNISSADEILLSSWVYQCFAAGQLYSLITQDEKDVDWKILERMVKVGLWCVQDHQSLRPTMKKVILMLEGLKDIPDPPSPSGSVE